MQYLAGSVWLLLPAVCHSPAVNHPALLSARATCSNRQPHRYRCRRLGDPAPSACRYDFSSCHSANAAASCPPRQGPRAGNLSRVRPHVVSAPHRGVELACGTCGVCALTVRSLPQGLIEGFTCAICSSLPSEPVTTHCGHSFCEGCFDSSCKQGTRKCPMCRESVSTESRYMQVLCRFGRSETMRSSSPRSTTSAVGGCQKKARGWVGGWACRCLSVLKCRGGWEHMGAHGTGSSSCPRGTVHYLRPATRHSLAHAVVVLAFVL